MFSLYWDAMAQTVKKGDAAKKYRRISVIDHIGYVISS